MRRRIALLWISLMIWGNVAEAEWIPLWQSSENDAICNGLERVYALNVEWNGLPWLDSNLNTLIKSMLSNSKIEYVSRKTEDIGYARWDWYLQKKSVLDFSMIVQDGLYYEQSNLLGGETVAFDSQEFTRFIDSLSQQSDMMPANLDILFDLMRSPFLESMQLNTLQGMLDMIDQWAQSMPLTERARPAVMLPGLFGTKASVYQIDREAFITFLDHLGSTLFQNDSPADRTVQDPETLLSRNFPSWADVLTQPSKTIADLMPEDMPPIEYREVFCYDQMVSKQLDINIGSNWFYFEWAPSNDSILVSCKFNDVKVSVLFSFQEEPPVLERKLQTARNLTLAEIQLSINDIDITAIRTSIQDFQSNGTKETISTQIKWVLESDKLFGDEVLTVSVQSKDVATGQQTNYKRTRETDIILSGLQFDGTPIINAHETVMFRKPTDTLILTEPLRPGLMAQEDLEAWLDSLRDIALQVCFTILGRIPSENANYLLTLMRPPS